MNRFTEEEKHQQILKEVKGTMVLIAIVAAWHVGFGFALDGIDVMVLGMPLWFFVSTIGAFVISVVGVVVLLKTVFKNFDLGEDSDEEGALSIEDIPSQVLMADKQEGGEV